MKTTQEYLQDSDSLESMLCWTKSTFSGKEEAYIDFQNNRNVRIIRNSDGSLEDILVYKLYPNPMCYDLDSFFKSKEFQSVAEKNLSLEDILQYIRDLPTFVPGESQFPQFNDEDI